MRILLAVDGSTASQKAVDEVAHRPWPRPSLIRIISVVTPYIPGAGEFVPGAATPLELVLDHEADARRLAIQVGNQLQPSGIPIEVVARQGDPARTIVEEATQWQADLIVVGSHGRRGLERLLLGSVARAVVTDAPCSVEVVRERRDAA